MNFIKHPLTLTLGKRVNEPGWNRVSHEIRIERNPHYEKEFYIGKTCLVLIHDTEGLELVKPSLSISTQSGNQRENYRLTALTLATGSRTLINFFCVIPAIQRQWKFHNDSEILLTLYFRSLKKEYAMAWDERLSFMKTLDKKVVPLRLLIL